jgi:CRP-like cAMP-binding protein
MPSRAMLEAGLTGNLFLDTLPLDSASRILPFLERSEAATGTPIATSGAAIEHAIFPIGSVVSAVAHMRDGSDVEIALIGREGFYGTVLVLGASISTSEAMVQIPNALYRMRAADFCRCLAEDETFRNRALRYVAASIDAISQFSACNRLHPIDQRAARWLLMAHDRVPTDYILLTHEYLATMLGVRRPGVSVAAAELERLELISYHRGRILVTNRPGLEAASCECYNVANDALYRLLGYDVRKGARHANGLATGTYDSRQT